MMIHVFKYAKLLRSALLGHNTLEFKLAWDKMREQLSNVDNESKVQGARLRQMLSKMLEPLIATEQNLDMLIALQDAKSDLGNDTMRIGNPSPEPEELIY